MKLAFSNIAWSPHDQPQVLELLQGHGVAGIEVAPTKVWPDWQGATAQAAAQFGNRMRESGFEIPALQAVLFGRPEARLFDADGETALIAHLTHVAELAASMGAGNVVLGAPKQRQRGNLSYDEAMERAAGVLHELAERFDGFGTCLCIEPNPRRYDCDFIVNADEGAELVRRVGHRGFGLHLDAAAMFLEGDELPEVWRRVGALVRHFHISEPDLGDFRAPQVPHGVNLGFLEQIEYGGWCSVEMREPSESLAVTGPWSVIGARA
jgi:sugar phosphate isomerase/epimerase